MKRWLVLAMLCAVVGCNFVYLKKPLQIKTPASPAEYAPYKTPGTATITGQAITTTANGDIWRATGRTVTLDPATTYARAWYAQAGTVWQRFDEMPPDQLFHEARQTTTADVAGRFTFRDLPAGSYIVRTVILRPGGSSLAPKTGILVSTIVTVGQGETREVTLTSLIPQ